MSIGNIERDISALQWQMERVSDALAKVVPGWSMAEKPVTVHVGKPEMWLCGCKGNMRDWSETRCDGCGYIRPRMMGEEEHT